MLARWLSGRAVVFAVTMGCLLSSSRPVAAQPADKATIDSRIELGVKFLKAKQKPAGYWGDGTGPGPGKGWGVGYTALAGIALLECGVKTDDPVIKRAANVVRAVAYELEDTYELALAILFLDRMKTATDKRIIQLLAGRLMAAQMPSGGWGYKAQKYSERDVMALIAGLRKLSDPKKPADLAKIRDSLPEDMRRLAVIIDPGPGRLPADAKEKRNDLLDATTDNSNTHFAMIGLWTARKYDIPVDRTFTLVNRRFRTSQGAGGTWGYDFNRTGADGGPQFTSIALLALAIGHVVAPEPNIKPETDPVIVKAFVALSKSVGAPAGDVKNRPKIKDIGGLYFLWAMERIAVLYDVRKLGNKDWYLWGAEILVWNQLADGSWGDDGGFPGQNEIVNTCLALMFLRRANLTPDLSKQLVVDPGTLLAKIDDKISPKPEPPPPSPKVEEPQPIAIAPMPHTVEPKPTPTPTAGPPAPAPQAETADSAPPAKKTPWPLIILGVLVAGVAGGGLAFLVAKRMKKDDEEEDSEKKKKKGKKKIKAEADGGKASSGKKAKAKVEVEEDE